MYRFVVDVAGDAGIVAGMDVAQIVAEGGWAVAMLVVALTVAKSWVSDLRERLTRCENDHKEMRDILVKFIDTRYPER